MLARETNRRLGEPRPIPAGTTDLLRTVAEREGGRLHVITGRDDIGYRKNFSSWSRYRSPIALPLC
jgi:hypothetical protein